MKGYMNKSLLKMFLVFSLWIGYAIAASWPLSSRVELQQLDQTKSGAVRAQLDIDHRVRTTTQIAGAGLCLFATVFIFKKEIKEIWETVS